MYLEEINSRIQREICVDTLFQISDANLLPEYIKHKSLKNNVAKLETIFNKYDVIDPKKTKIIEEYMEQMIPPGLKANIITDCP